MNKRLKDYYSTSDLACAAALSLFYPIEIIDRSNPSKSLFFFKRESQLDEYVEAFWRKELKIEPQTYFSQLKFIKSRLYEDR